MNEKNLNSGKSCHPLCLGLVLLSALCTSTVMMRPAMAQQPTGWVYGAVAIPSHSTAPSPGGYGGFSTATGSGSGLVNADISGIPQKPGIGPANAVVFGTATSVANSLPGGSASASSSIGSQVSARADWYGSGIPSGVTLTKTSLIMATCSAAASYKTVNGAIQVTGSASASGGTLGEYNTLFGGNSTISPQLSATSGSTVLPAGAALSTTYPSGVVMTGSITTAHTRGVGGIYQNGSLVWGENVDIGFYEDQYTYTYTSSYFQANPSLTAVGLQGDENSLSQSANSGNGSAALAEELWMTRVSAM